MEDQSEPILDLHDVIAITGHRTGEKLWLDVKAGMYPNATEPKVQGRKSRWKRSAVQPGPPADDLDRERKRARDLAKVEPGVEIHTFEEVLDFTELKSKETVRKLIHKGLFPRPIWVKYRGRPWWRDDELIRWEQARSALRRQHEQE